MSSGKYLFIAAPSYIKCVATLPIVLALSVLIRNHLLSINFKQCELLV